MWFPFPRANLRTAGECLKTKESLNFKLGIPYERKTRRRVDLYGDLGTSHHAYPENLFKTFDAFPDHNLMLFFPFQYCFCIATVNQMNQRESFIFLVIQRDQNKNDITRYELCIAPTGFQGGSILLKNLECAWKTSYMYVCSFSVS